MARDRDEYTINAVGHLSSQLSLVVVQQCAPSEVEQVTPERSCTARLYID